MAEEVDGYGIPAKPKVGEAKDTKPTKGSPLVTFDAEGIEVFPTDTPSNETQGKEAQQPAADAGPQPESKASVQKEGEQPRAGGRKKSSTVDEVRDKLKAADLKFLDKIKERNWRVTRATPAEETTVVELGSRLEAEPFKVSLANIAKAFNLTTITYGKWKDQAGVGKVRTQRATKSKKATTDDQPETKPKATPVRQHDQRLVEMDIAPIVAANRQVVIDLLTIGKPQSIKNAIIGLIEGS